MKKYNFSKYVQKLWFKSKILPCQQYDKEPTEYSRLQYPSHPQLQHILYKCQQQQQKEKTIDRNTRIFLKKGKLWIFFKEVISGDQNKNKGTNGINKSY